MNNDLLHIVYRTEQVGIRTIKEKYIAEITHKGLNDFLVLSAPQRSILQSKVDAHVAKLSQKWAAIVEKETQIKSKEASLKEAERQTELAQAAMNQVEKLLTQGLENKNRIDWTSLKDTSPFPSPSPANQLNKLLQAVPPPTKPAVLSHPPKPQSIAANLTFFDNLLPSRKKAKVGKAKQQSEALMQNWITACYKVDLNNRDIEQAHENKIDTYNTELEKVKKQNAIDTENWELAKKVYLEEQARQHDSVDRWRAAYLQLEPEAVASYAEQLLSQSSYPEAFPKSFEIGYNPESKILIVEYALPNLEELPTLIEVRFIKNELKSYFISETQLLKIYDTTLYNITLRSLYELFSTDEAGAIEAVTFNGWVNAVNKATGNPENTCVLSVMTKKEPFMAINLEQVDPKTCFKNLKGIGSSKLSGLTAIQPILQLDKSDRRFVNAYDVADRLDNSTNLASMDWEDFEHLIREVFAKEFSVNGGEVKVTQASHDGGVDAIAFDPDPIRGGKIIIQAKRYTNTVGVSAVRDLYGTVHNEGANKGILVTTADFGPDAYEFIKGKPLTLMNGANLLYLLEKHGHNARIDLKEAKKQAS